MNDEPTFNDRIKGYGRQNYVAMRRKAVAQFGQFDTEGRYLSGKVARMTVDYYDVDSVSKYLEENYPELSRSVRIELVCQIHSFVLDYERKIPEYVEEWMFRTGHYFLDFVPERIWKADPFSAWMDPDEVFSYTCSDCELVHWVGFKSGEVIVD